MLSVPFGSTSGVRSGYGYTLSQRSMRESYQYFYEELAIVCDRDVYKGYHSDLPLD